MENQNNNKGLKFCIFVLFIIIIALSGYIFYDKTNDKNIVNESNANVTEKNETKENNQINNDQNKTYTIENLKSIYDSFDDDDTDLEKAQKIAKELMEAVNNKDYYYLAKMIGEDADYFVKYGIYNYHININDYEILSGQYVFKETYDSKSDIEEELGHMLVITFEDGGRIAIDPNCTGVAGF